MKACSKCGQTKPSSEFGRDRTKRGGHAGQCKACKLEYKKAWRHTDRGRAAHRGYNRKIAGTPKVLARQAVMIEVRAARLSRAKDRVCVHCGKQAQHYHHHLGYAKEHWLDVEPVCRKCHRTIS